MNTMEKAAEKLYQEVKIGGKFGVIHGLQHMAVHEVDRRLIAKFNPYGCGCRDKGRDSLQRRFTKQIPISWVHYF